MGCIFCKIVNAEIPARIVYETSDILSFLDIKPINLGHTLVIPKNHYESLKDAPNDVLEKMVSAAREISSILREVLKDKCSGINLHLADGRDAGQEIEHIHLHIIPRHKNDGFGLKLPAHYGNITQEEIDEIHRKIRAITD